MSDKALAQAVKDYARQLGFPLAGITTPKPPAHIDAYRHWLQEGAHGEMQYLAEERAIERRANPRLILPECRSILVLGIPYHPPPVSPPKGQAPCGRLAAYALGHDYHLVIPERLQKIVEFLEDQTGQSIPNRFYTDTGPILERDLAQRAGLGWIGRNTCLIAPRLGSYFFLAEILLGIALPADDPFTTDHCGTCARCIQACPTSCIRPDRTLDARRCISYLTIENKGEIPLDLRRKMGHWIFGCDICQMVCPWNQRFAQSPGDPAFAPRPETKFPNLPGELALTPSEFNHKFKESPVKRAKRRGYLRNICVALGNSTASEIPALHSAASHEEELVASHAAWAMKELEKKDEALIDSHRKPRKIA
jgi:epoxyqueuosine reductase